MPQLKVSVSTKDRSEMTPAERRAPKSRQRPDFTEYTAYHSPFRAVRVRSSVRFGMDLVPDTAYIERRMWSKAERKRRKELRTPWRRPIKRSVIQ